MLTSNTSDTTANKYGDGVLLEVVLCVHERQRWGGEGKKNEILKVLLCLLDIMKSLKIQMILDYSSKA